MRRFLVLAACVLCASVAPVGAVTASRPAAASTSVRRGAGHASRRLAAQGANLDGTFRASGSSNLRAVGRNIPEQIILIRIIVVRINVKAGEFKPAPLDGIEGRDGHLLAILALLSNRT